MPPISVTMGPGMPPTSVPDPVLSLRGTKATWTSMPYSRSLTQPTPAWIASSIARREGGSIVFLCSLQEFVPIVLHTVIQLHN